MTFEILEFTNIDYGEIELMMTKIKLNNINNHCKDDNDWVNHDFKLPQHHTTQQQHQPHVPHKSTGQTWMGPKLFSPTPQSTAETKELRKQRFTPEDSHLHRPEELVPRREQIPNSQIFFLSNLKLAEL